MKTKTNKDILDGYSVRLKATMGLESHSPESALFVLTVSKKLAEGNPVSVQQVAESLSLGGQKIQTTIEYLESANQIGLNESGDIVAIAGLTLSQTNHKVIVDGIELYTWCAIDTLFFPAFLDKTVTVESRSPVSGKIIRITVTPRHGILTAEPASTCLSLVIPTDSPSSRFEDEVSGCHPKSGRYGESGSFCSRVFYFESMKEAESWVRNKSDIVALDIQDAYDLAQTVWVEPLLLQASHAAI